MCELYFVEDVEKDLSKLDKVIAQRIFDKLIWYAENFEFIVPEPLLGNFKNMYKFRIGDYRAIYTIDKKNKIITIHIIEHRKDIYKIGRR